MKKKYLLILKLSNIYPVNLIKEKFRRNEIWQNLLDYNEFYNALYAKPLSKQFTPLIYSPIYFSSTIPKEKNEDRISN